LVKWLKQNPELVRLRSEELVDRFQAANPDLTIADMSSAFAQSSEGGASPAAGIAAGMFGD
jgi:hypothetical protein